MSKETKFAFISESKGIGDLKTKDLIELKELVDRQNSLLANKSLISKLKDKGEKIKKVRDQVANELKTRESFVHATKQKLNNSACEWRGTATNKSMFETNEHELEDKDVIKILSEHDRRNISHIQRLIDKEKDPDFSFRPSHSIVAQKLKKVIPKAHIEEKNCEKSVKTLHLDESLELLTAQISALKVFESTSKQKRAEERLEELLNESESGCENISEDLHGEEELDSSTVQVVVNM